MNRRISLRRKDPKTLTLGGMDSFLLDVLFQAPASGIPDPETASRFFPSPTAGADEEVDSDWAQFVHPEMEEHFEGSRGVLAGDLEKCRETAKNGFEVDIPDAHRWDWVQALNQARLALATLHGFGDEEQEEKSKEEPGPAMALFKVQFYGLLQEWLLTEFDDGDVF